MIGEMCSKPVVTVSPQATITEAARLMRQHHVGALVVVNDDAPRGMLTDRDITLRIVAEGRDPAKVRVADVMHGNVATLTEDQGIYDAAKLFSARGVRRLPVVDRRGTAIGILALDDLLMLLGREMQHVATALGNELGRSAAA